MQTVLQPLAGIGADVQEQPCQVGRYKRAMLNMIFTLRNRHPIPTLFILSRGEVWTIWRPDAVVGRFNGPAIEKLRSEVVPT